MANTINELESLVGELEAQLASATPEMRPLMARQVEAARKAVELLRLAQSTGADPSAAKPAASGDPPGKVSPDGTRPGRGRAG
jgi:hypothetical protein